MSSKHIQFTLCTLTIVVALVYGETRPEIFGRPPVTLGNDGQTFDDKTGVRTSSSNKDDVDTRYYNQGNIGNQIRLYLKIYETR